MDSDGDDEPVAVECEERTGGAPAAVRRSKASLLATGVSGVAIRARSLSMDPGPDKAKLGGRVKKPGPPLGPIGDATEEKDEVERDCFTNKLGFAALGDSVTAAVIDGALPVLRASKDVAFGPKRLIDDRPKESDVSLLTVVAVVFEENKDFDTGLSG